VYNYHDSRTYGSEWSRILSRLYGFGKGMIFGVVTPLWIILCGNFF
jgi:hypothetical protein